MEWLGEVPAHWVVKRTKFAARLRSGHTPSRQNAEYWQDCTIPWFSLADVWQIRDGQREYVEETAERISELGLASSAARLLSKGTVILSRTASVGFSAIMGTEMATTQDFVNWVCREELLPEFLLYQFRAMQPVFRHLTMGSTHQTIYMPDVGKFVAVVPPREEQEAIVRLLRLQTAQVDALLAKNQRLLELLEEQRAALITRVVTQGLDPDVPKKASGVEWLGEIPAHWEVKPLKQLSDLQTGLTLGKKYPAGGLISRPYLRVANVQDGFLDLSDVAEIELPANEFPRYELRPGDVVVTEGGDFDKPGRGCVWFGQIPGCLHQNHIFAIRPDSSSLASTFLSRVLESGYGRAYFTATSKQSTKLASTNSTKLKNLPIPVPPLPEQQAIADFLDRESAQLDVLTAKSHEAIARLRELRAAWITAAVTGKIDVRGVAA